MPKAVRWMSDREWNVRWNKDSQKRMSEDVTDRMSDMPDGMSEDMTDRMSDMPDRMSEDAPDRLTEDARRMSVECQIECQKI